MRVADVDLGTPMSKLQIAKRSCMRSLRYRQRSPFEVDRRQYILEDWSGDTVFTVPFAQVVEEPLGFRTTSSYDGRQPNFEVLLRTNLTLSQAGDHANRDAGVSLTDAMGCVYAACDLAGHPCRDLDFDGIIRERIGLQKDK